MTKKIKPSLVEVPKNVAALNPFDPENINARLYHQVSLLLGQLEQKGARTDEITIRERIAALTAIGRLQIVFAALRKGRTNDPGRGATARKYESAFTHAGGRRKADAGSAATAAAADLEPDDWFERGDDEGDAASH